MLWALLAVALFQLGRGPGNMLWGPLAIISAVTVLANIRLLIRFPAITVSLFGFLAIISLSGISLAGGFPPWPLKYWLSVFCSAMVFFHIQLYPPDFRALREKAGQIALFAVVALAIHWLYLSWTVVPEELVVARRITGTVAVVLAPWAFIHGRWSVLKKWLLMISFTGLLMLLDSRTEVLALLVALCVFQLACWQRLRWILLLVPVLLLLVLMPKMTDASSVFSFAQLNYISSSRMEIWSSAIEASKESLWFGHGLYSSVRADFLPVDIRHIHNTILELVYETGLIGFASICVFLALSFMPMAFKCKYWPKADRRQAAVILACAAATVTVLFFDKSLHSVFARYYIFVLAGLAFCLFRQSSEAALNEAETLAKS